MKNSLRWRTFMLLFIFVTSNLAAQKVVVSQKELKVKRHTKMQQFEPDLVISANDRLAIKKKRKEETQRKLMMIDTMDISERKRRKLLKDLVRTPYSTRLAKATAIVDTRFEDDEANDNE